MNRKVVVGVVLLLVAIVYFYFAPPVYDFEFNAVPSLVIWVVLLPGIVLALLGIVMLATGLRSKKESA